MLEAIIFILVFFSLVFFFFSFLILVFYLVFFFNFLFIFDCTGPSSLLSLIAASRGYSLVSGHALLIAVASLVEHRP